MLGWGAGSAVMKEQGPSMEAGVLEVTLIAEDERFAEAVPALDAVVDACLAAAYVDAGVEGVAEMACVLLDDSAMQAYNRQYRGKDAPTNVLSFPADVVVPEGEAEAMMLRELGDILLSYDTIAREAAEQGKSFEAHLRHMLVHGLLHLLGYDHLDEADAVAMEALEIAILAKQGVANPYLGVVLCVGGDTMCSSHEAGE